MISSQPRLPWVPASNTDVVGHGSGIPLPSGRFLLALAVAVLRSYSDSVGHDSEFRRPSGRLFSFMLFHFGGPLGVSVSLCFGDSPFPLLVLTSSVMARRTRLASARRSFFASAVWFSVSSTDVVGHDSGSVPFGVSALAFGVPRFSF